MSSYNADQGFPPIFGDSVVDDRSLEDILNGEQGPLPGTAKEYSCDPDYESVDSDLFRYLE